ncbi:MAG: DoxX family membrane protein [Planctomycetota bacterium]|nr:DoxX family membrane protein [Planctomycetota bacterium]
MTGARSLAERLLILLARVAIGGLMIFTAYLKLKPADGLLASGPQTFALNIKAYQILPDHLVMLAAFVIPWAELLAGLLLLLGLRTRAASLVLCLLLASFTAGVVSVIARGMNIECGCFGSFKLLCSGPITWCKVGENALLLALAAWPLVRGPGLLAVDSLLDRPTQPRV